MAGDLRHQIRTRIAAGEEPEAIRAWLIERYGDYISYTPAAESQTTWPLFAVPRAAALIAVAVVASRIRRRAMSWLVAIALALAAFAVVAFVRRAPREAGRRSARRWR